jgi:hypothetical protein
MTVLVFFFIGACALDATGRDVPRSGAAVGVLALIAVPATWVFKHRESLRAEWLYDPATVKVTLGQTSLHKWATLSLLALGCLAVAIYRWTHSGAFLAFGMPVLFGFVIAGAMWLTRVVDARLVQAWGDAKRVARPSAVRGNPVE